MNQLKQFYLDKATNQAVKEFFENYIDEQIVKDVRANGEAPGTKEAIELVEGAWRRLEQLYGEKPKKKLINTE